MPGANSDRLQVACDESGIAAGFRAQQARPTAGPLRTVAGRAQAGKTSIFGEFIALFV